jgi:hypothetical protein
VKQGGNGITFEFQFGPDIQTNVDTACIFFSNLVEHPLDMMFWISNCQSGARMTMLKIALRNHKYVKLILISGLFLSCIQFIQPHALILIYILGTL